MASSPHHSARDVARLEAFTDGVFAVAITLLVLDIKIPAAEALPEGMSLWSALGHRWPNFLAYVVTFAILGIMWSNHHDICHYIGRVDRAFLMLNLALLLLVCVQPFVTALVSEYLREPERGSQAVVLYAGTLTVTATVYNLLWRYAASGRRLIRAETPQPAVDDVTKRYLFGPVVYGAATVLAYFSAIASLVTMGLLAIFFAIPFKRGE